MTKRFVKEIRNRAPAVFSRRSFLVLVLPAFSIFYLVSAVRIESPPAHLEVSARAFPMVVGAALVISAVVVAWQELRQPRSSSEEETTRPSEPSLATAEEAEGEGENEITSWLDFWVAFGAVLAMIVFLDNLGFVLVATGLTGGLAIYLERRHVARNLGFAFAYAAILYFLFDRVFEIYLPSGPLPW